MSDTVKLMYLQEAPKDSPVRFVIQGLTRKSESYEEGIKCLKECNVVSSRVFLCQKQNTTQNELNILTISPL